jgi:hypothetical protein
MEALPGQFLVELNEGATRAREGEIEPRQTETHAGSGWLYDLGESALLFRERL